MSMTVSVSTKFLVSAALVLTCFVFCMSKAQPAGGTSAEAETETETEEQPKQFRYLRLALALPSTVRKVFLCRQNPKGLIISKFHPVKDNYDNRSTQGIDKPTLDKVKDELLVYWPIMTYPEGIFKYRHFQEIYDIDGRLCDTTLKGEKYFLKAIELTKLHHQQIYKALTLYGTPPSEHVTYSTEKIKEAIRGYTHKQPQITCYQHQEIEFLYEIMVCFDESGDFVNCQYEPPENACQNSNQHIIIPPLDE